MLQTNVQLMGRPKYLNDRPEGRSNHRPEGLAKEERLPFSNSGPPLRPERSLRSPAHLRTASPTGKPGQSTTSDSDPTSPTGVCKDPAHYSSSTGTNQPGTPARKGPGNERRKQGRAHKSNHDTRDRTLYAYRNSTLQPP